MQSQKSYNLGRIWKKLSLLVVILLIGLLCYSDDEFYIVNNNNLNKTVDVSSDNYKNSTRIRGIAVESFTGTITGYGPDCIGCDGYSACSPRQNFKNGNIYYEDDTYGTLRIVAADKKYPCGTIIRINESNQLAEPIYAVVLDRGGAIGVSKKVQVDLLYAKEADVYSFGIKKNINFDVLRLGW